jgi:hypothetical protein
MLEMLLALSGWLADTGLSQGIRAVSWIVPLMQTIHILGIAAVMGTAVLIDLRVLGLAVPSQPVQAMVRRLLPPMWIALVVLLLSGAALVLAEPNRSVVNPAFQLKMAMLLVVVTLTILLAKCLRAQKSPESAPAEAGPAKLIAAVSIAIWIAIIFAGRFIAYIEPFGAAGAG